MMQKIQKFGGAMFTPALLFAFSGIVVGFCTLFSTEAIMGSIAGPDTMWTKCWYVVKEGAWTLFRQVPLLFVVALPVGLAKKQQARCCMEALVLYITFNYFLSAILTNWGSLVGIDMAVEAASGSGLTTIANIKTLDTNMLGALVISGVVVALHNRYFDTELPEWLGVFKGASFICMIGFFVMLGMAVLFALVWPPIQRMISAMQDFFVASGTFGVFVYSFLNRILIPTGLHHFIYMPFKYDNIVVNGGIEAAWSMNLSAFAASSQPLKELFPEGGFSLFGMSKVFSPVGIAAAFYTTARPEKKKAVLGLMIPVVLTAMMAGITEPIEFTFLFIAPPLFIVHSVLDGLLCAAAYQLGVVGEFSSGLIKWFALNWMPLMKNHWQTYLIQIAVGLVFTFIWFITFRFMILKFDYKTPGREDDDEAMKLYTKQDYKEKKEQKPQEGKNKNAVKAEAFLEALGGKENIESVTNCATRLRLTVKDPGKVAGLETFKRHGAHGLVAKGKSVQVIVGLSVPSVREEFEKML